MAVFLKGDVNYLYDSWYSPQTGIYQSKYPRITLPSDPYLDVVSFIFSQKHNGRHALIDSSTGSLVTYPELSTWVTNLAAGMDQIGLRQGDVVMLLLPNSIVFPAIFLAVLSLGAVVTPMNPLSSLTEIKKQALECTPRLVFGVEGKAKELETALGCCVIGVPQVPDFNPVTVRPTERGFHELIRSFQRRSPPRPKIKQKHTAAILYSSGTTGSAKGVVLTHGNFIAMIELFVKFEASLYDYPPEKNRYLAIVPMFHVYGLSLFVMGLLSIGSTVVTMSKFDADDMVRAIDKHEITHLPAVPPILSCLTKLAKGGGADVQFRSLKQISCGAAPTSKLAIEAFLDAFPHVDFIQGYGMTESTAMGTRGYNTAQVHKHTSVGLLSPNVQAKVVDIATGSCLPPGSTGELWLHSPGNMKGYLNNADAITDTIDKDRWLHTGDIVFFDHEGYLYVIDRLKEVIKYKGFQIAPVDLEAVVMSHPEVLDAAVIGSPDDEAGEIPVAFVVLQEGSSVSQASLMEYVSRQVAPYKKVRKVYFRGSLPRSAAGKVLRRELKSLLVASKL